MTSHKIGAVLRRSWTAAGVRILATAVSAVSLGIATWITTLQTPIVEQEIANLDSSIKELRYQITKDLVQGLYAMDLVTERRINLIDVRLERVMNSSRTELEGSLLKEVMDNTLAQITRWNSMFLFERQPSTHSLPPSVDPNTPIEKSILTLDHALAQARKDAYSRLDKLITEANEHELQKAGCDKTLKSWEKQFRLFQMIGLLTLLVAIGIEAHTKLREDVIDDKKTNTRESEDSAGVPDTPPQS